MVLLVAKLSKWFTKVLHPTNPFTASRRSHSEVPTATEAHSAAWSMPHSSDVRPAVHRLSYSSNTPTPPLRGWSLDPRLLLSMPLVLSGQLFFILCKQCFPREAGLFTLLFHPLRIPTLFLETIFHQDNYISTSEIIFLLSV